MTIDSAPTTYREVLSRSLIRHKRTLYWAIPVAIISQGFMLAFPYVLGLAIDYGVTQQNANHLALGALGIAVVLIAGSQTWRLQFTASRVINSVEAHALRREMNQRIFDARLSPVKQPAGEVLTISTSDAHRATAVVDLLTWSGPAMLAFFVSVVLLGTFHWLLAVLALVGALLAAGVQKLLAPGLIRRHTAQQEAVADTSALATDFVKGLRTIQGIGAQDAAMARYRTSSHIARLKSIENAKVSGWNSGIAVVMAGILTAALAGYSGYLTLRGELSIGEFITVVGLSQYLVEPLHSLGEQAIMWASSKASAKRSATLLEGEAITSHTVPDAVQPGAIELQGLCYGALNGFDLSVQPGAFVAVFSPTQNAATDLTSVLTATCPDGELPLGQARIGASDLAQADPARVREIVLSEPHHVDIFEGSLRDAINLGRAGKAELDDSQINQVLAAAGAGDIVDLLSEGLDTILHDRGANLSGGQRQRIALARAIAAERDVLILRDPTTAVDSVTEANIARGLRSARASSSQITLVFTSAPALLEVADEVVYISEGRVHSRAGHHDLMQHDSSYESAVRR